MNTQGKRVVVGGQWQEVMFVVRLEVTGTRISCLQGNSFVTSSYHACHITYIPTADHCNSRTAPLIWLIVYFSLVLTLNMCVSHLFTSLQKKHFIKMSHLNTSDTWNLVI